MWRACWGTGVRRCRPLGGASRKIKRRPGRPQPARRRKSRNGRRCGGSGGLARRDGGRRLGGFAFSTSSRHHARAGAKTPPCAKGTSSSMRSGTSASRSTPSATRRMPAPREGRHEILQGDVGQALLRTRRSKRSAAPFTCDTPRSASVGEAPGDRGAGRGADEDEPDAAAQIGQRPGLLGIEAAPARCGRASITRPARNPARLPRDAPASAGSPARTGSAATARIHRRLAAAPGQMPGDGGNALQHAPSRSVVRP